MRALFLHMPKCAGTSVRKTLKSVVSGRLIEDYNSYFRIPQELRRSVVLNSIFSPNDFPSSDGVVYGHFFPVKYLGGINSDHLSDIKLYTIIRDPIDRLRSHFDYWNSGDFSDHYLWRKMKSCNWGFEEFALSGEMKDFYSQHIVNIPFQRFSYIGLYENLEQSIQTIIKEFGNNKDTFLPHENKTPNKKSIFLSNKISEEIKNWHSNDYMMYEFARKRFHNSF